MRYMCSTRILVLPLM